MTLMQVTISPANGTKERKKTKKKMFELRSPWKFSVGLNIPPGVCALCVCWEGMYQGDIVTPASMRSHKQHLIFRVKTGVVRPLNPSLKNERNV